MLANLAEAYVQIGGIRLAQGDLAENHGSGGVGEVNDLDAAEPAGKVCPARADLDRREI